MSNALDDLIAAVEADLDIAHHHAAVFPSESAGGHCTWHDSHKASNGSLDAALALHNAVLPGWSYYIGWTTGEPKIVASVWPRDTEWKDYDATAENPARAWLLAVLKAMKEGKDA